MISAMQCQLCHSCDLPGVWTIRTSRPNPTNSHGILLGSEVAFDPEVQAARQVIDAIDQESTYSMLLVSRVVGGNTHCEVKALVSDGDEPRRKLMAVKTAITVLRRAEAASMGVDG